MGAQSISTAKAREVRFFSDPTRFESLDEFLRSDKCKLRGAIEILYGEFPLHFFTITAAHNQLLSVSKVQFQTK